MAKTPTPVPASATPRWLRVTLVVSLTLNVLFAGLAVGAAVNYRQDGGPPRSLDISSGPLGRALEPDDRRALARALRDVAEGRPPGRAERARMIARLADLLRQTPFDAEAFGALIEAQGAQAQDVQSAVRAAFVAQVQAMSPERRAALADRLQSEVQRGGDDGRDRQ